MDDTNPPVALTSSADCPRMRNFVGSLEFKIVLAIGVNSAINLSPSSKVLMSSLTVLIPSALRMFPGDAVRASLDLLSLLARLLRLSPWVLAESNVMARRPFLPKRLNPSPWDPIAGSTIARSKAVAAFTSEKAASKFSVNSI